MTGVIKFQSLADVQNKRLDSWFPNYYLLQLSCPINKLEEIVLMLRYGIEVTTPTSLKTVCSKYILLLSDYVKNTTGMCLKSLRFGCLLITFE